MQRHLNILRDTRGQVLTESVILIVCILVLAIAAWRTFGETILRLIDG